MLSNVSVTVTTGFYIWYHLHPYIPYKSILEYLLERKRKKSTASIETQTDWAIDHHCYEVLADDDGILTQYMYIDNKPVYL